MAQRKETVRAQPHFVGLLTDTFSHIFAIWQRSISAFSPSHDSFSNDRFSSHTALNSVWRWCFVNTATKETTRLFRHSVSTCSGFSPDSLVQHRTRMRVQAVLAAMRVLRLSCLGSRICHKSLVIQFDETDDFLASRGCHRFRSIYSRFLPIKLCCGTVLRKTPYMEFSLFSRKTEPAS